MNAMLTRTTRIVLVAIALGCSVNAFALTLARASEPRRASRKPTRRRP